MNTAQDFCESASSHVTAFWRHLPGAPCRVAAGCHGHPSSVLANSLRHFLLEAAWEPETERGSELKCLPVSAEVSAGYVGLGREMLQSPVNMDCDMAGAGARLGVYARPSLQLRLLGNKDTVEVPQLSGLGLSAASFGTSPTAVSVTLLRN